MNEQTTPDSLPLNPATYAPRWVSFASSILDDLFDGTRSHASDLTTQRIMTTCLKTLAKGNALSEKQTETFLENIRVRLGRPDFDWSGRIQLSRSQRPHARVLLAKAAAAPSPQVNEEPVQEVSGNHAALVRRIEVLEAIVEHLLSVSGSEPASMPPTFDTNAAETEPFPLETAAFPDLTKQNEAKRNHDGDMTCLTGTMTSSITQPAAADDISPSTSEVVIKSHEYVASGQASGGERIVVSLFRNDPAKAPSANIELGQERFSLVFASADVAEEKVYTLCKPEWRKWFDEHFGAGLREKSRHCHASDERYVLSPIYAQRDRYGLKDPVEGNVVAILLWSDASEPEAVILVHGTAHTRIPLKKANQTKSKSPTHKGSVALAA
jgi:hypothetical protein